MYFKNIKGVIFDLDGTLIDSMSMWADVDKEFLKENGAEIPEGFSDHVKTQTLLESCEYFNSLLPKKREYEYISNRIFELVEVYYRERVTLKEGVFDLLDKLDELGIISCIATNTYPALAKTVTERFLFNNRIKFTLTCIDLGENISKRTPDIFCKSAEMLGTDIRETIVIEDSLHAIRSANCGGFKTIGVYDDYSKDDWDGICKAATYNVRSLIELV